jgi:hypothetical protein
MSTPALSGAGAVFTDVIYGSFSFFARIIAHTNFWAAIVIKWVMNCGNRCSCACFQQNQPASLRVIAVCHLL